MKGDLPIKDELFLLVARRNVSDGSPIDSDFHSEATMASNEPLIEARAERDYAHADSSRYWNEFAGQAVSSRVVENCSREEGSNAIDSWGVLVYQVCRTAPTNESIPTHCGCTGNIQFKMVINVLS